MKSRRGGRGTTTTRNTGGSNQQAQVNPAHAVAAGAAFIAQMQQQAAQAAAASVPGWQAVPQGQTAYQPLNQQQVQAVHQNMAAALNVANIDVRRAVRRYTTDDSSKNASGYNKAQELNNKLMTGAALDQTEQMMVRGLDAGMKPIGADTTLWRADHAITSTGSGLMERLGLSNYQSMTPAQLNAAVAGMEWTEGKYLSTSYSKTASPFIGGSQSGGRSVIWKIRAPGSTMMIEGDTKQAEYILARGGRYKATAARFTGKTVSPRAYFGSLKQIEIDVDIIG